MDIMQESLALHRKLNGKIEIKNKVKLNDMHDMTLAYTPGVARACLVIKDYPEEVFELTSKRNTVAVISDGTAVLGLGDIGPLAAIPVMEGKCALFKRFANVDAIPIVLNTKNVDEIVETIYRLSPSFGGINLEDISAPRCFEVEKRLRELCDIPVFHDDQHGTAIVVIAALMNALKIVNKEFSQITVAVSGAGSAGSAIIKMLIAVGVKNIFAYDREGILNSDEKYSNWVHQEIAEVTNNEKRKGSLADAMKGADVFIGVSVKGIVTEEMVKSMADNAIVLPMANPDPEIMPNLAKNAGARIIGTGRSDLPNQINNVLAFPGIFRGALDAKASDINEEMKIAAAKALAELVSEQELNENYIIVSPFDSRVGNAVSKAVYKAAGDTGVSRV